MAQVIYSSTNILYMYSVVDQHNLVFNCAAEGERIIFCKTSFLKYEAVSQTLSIL